MSELIPLTDDARRELRVGDVVRLASGNEFEVFGAPFAQGGMWVVPLQGQELGHPLSLVDYLVSRRPEPEAEQEQMAGEILIEVGLTLKALGCRHGQGHSDTPPMMFREWLLCAVGKREDEITALRAKLAALLTACEPLVKYLDALGPSWTGCERVHVRHCEPMQAGRVSPSIGDLRRLRDAAREAKE